MTEIPIIVSTNEVTVGGMVDKIDLQVGVGQQGQRGSRIFSGDVSPLTLAIDSPFFAGYTEFIYGDMYIQRSASNIAVWEWKNQPGGDTWVKTSDIAVAGGGGITSLDPDLTAIADLTGTSGLLRKSGINTWLLDTNTYLTSNQTVTLTGDATGSGSTSIAVTVVDDSHSHTGSTISALDAGATTTGTFNIARIPTGTTGTTVALGNHTHSYQPVDGDLTAIAAVSGTGYLRRTGVDTWVLDTPATATWGSISGTLSSQTDLQSALNGKQAADNDLTAIAALAGTSGFLKKTATDTWALDTSTYLTSNQTITLSGAVTGSGTTAISTSFSTNTVFPESISARNYILSTDGIPTTNLGNPTIPEMALFDSQFNNKLWFYDPTKITFEYTMDGTNWVTQSNSATEIKKLVGGAGATASSILIPNLAQKYRINIRNDGNYVFLNALYAYYSTNSHQTKVHIWVKRDDGSWIQRTSSTRNMSSWPGHLYMPFNAIPWSLSLTPGHYNDVRIEFIPVWTTGGSYDSQHIYLMNVEMWGGYPSGRRTIFNWDEDKNVTFPAQVTASSFSGSGAGLSSIPQSAVTSLVGDLSAKSPLASPTFTGTPTAPTAAVDTNTTQLATTAYVIGQGYLKSATASSTYQPLDADLTSIAGLAGASGLLRKTALNTWSLDTNTYLTGNQTITLSGDASGSGTTAITVVVADDSHSHTSATISALDASDVTTGIFDIARIPTGTTGTTVALGNHTHSYQPLDADLTAIAALAGASGILKKTALDTWTLDTTAYTTNTGTVTSVAMTVPTGLSISGTPITTSGTLALTLTAGYSIPTTASQTNWDSAYTDRMKWDGSSAGLTASTGRTSLGATTVGSNLFTLVNPTAVTFLRVNADNTVSTLDAATFRTAIGAGTSSTTGTVTSVAMSVPTGLSISGSPVTTSGTLALTLTSGYEIPTTAALAAKAPLASPIFTGTPSAPTAAVDTSTTQLATTAYVVNQGYLKSSTASSTYLPLSGGTLTGGNVVDTVLTIKNGASTNTELRLEHPYGMNASTLGFGDNTKREANISLYNTGLNFALTMDGSTITSSLIMYDGAAIVGGSAGSTPIGLSASTLHLWANQINATANMVLKRDWPSFVLAGTKAGSVVKNGSIYFQAGDGNQRWIVGASDDAESGSNAGSNLFIRRYSDANANLGNVLTINRATGLVAFSGAVSGLVPTSVDNTVPRFDGTTGQLQTSGVTITDDGAIQVFNATSDFHFSSAAANSANFYISNVSAGQNAAMFFRVNGYKRWFVGKEASAESGSNTGSNFRIWRYNDDGTSIGQAFGINRATGLVTIDAAGPGAGIELGVSGPRMMSGSGAPEAVVTAPVGSEWTETSTGITYDKMSGAGNTGWVARQFGAGYIEDAQAMMMMGVL